MTNNKAQQSPEKTAEQQQVLRDLLALGKKNGRLTLKEMADALSHLELESDDIDKLYETLESMGVEVETEGVLEKALGDGDDDSFEPDTVEEVPEEELIDTSAMAETFAIDDPVRMYLKEIGKVDLLTPEEEVTLAERMQKGSAAAERIAQADDLALARIEYLADAAPQRLTHLVRLQAGVHVLILGQDVEERQAVAVAVRVERV